MINGVEFDDVVQLCFFALCDAVKQFNPDKGYKFTTYIKYPLMYHFRVLLGVTTTKRDALKFIANLEIYDDEEYSSDNEFIYSFIDPNSEEPFEAIIDGMFQVELHDALQNALSKLPDFRAIAIRKRYFEGKTQKEIGMEMDKHPESVGRIQRIGLQLLKDDQNLQAFHDEVLTHLAYKGTGLTAFNQTGTSSVEMAVMRANLYIDERS